LEAPLGLKGRFGKIGKIGKIGGIVNLLSGFSVKERPLKVKLLEVPLNKEE
jgi:hypothetical protein